MPRQERTSMTKRTIWILNFGTTGFMSLIFIVSAFQRLFLESNDKDTIVIPFTIVILLYLILLTFIFYNKIFKWDKQQRQSFYMTTFPVTGLSVFILFNLGQSVVTRHEDLSTVEALGAIICGLNVATFCWGLMTKDN